jgi:ribosomal protein S18 acetylase RimI-like enzyme
MTGKNDTKSPTSQESGPGLKIFTNNTKPPSKTLINRLAMIFRAGFNNAPWDIYEFNLTPEKSVSEFTESVSMALNSGGALISVTRGRTPAGFSIVASLDFFSQDINKIAGYIRRPRDYQSPARYFKTLSQILGVPQADFGIIGYIQDVVVDSRFQGKGYGKILIQSSLKHLEDRGKKYVLAWTVNPIMAGILAAEGFKLISGIGDRGEGIDCLVDNGILIPTLVIPHRHRTNQIPKSTAAQHYVKVL